MIYFQLFLSFFQIGLFLSLIHIFVLTSAVIYIPVLSSAFGFERISALEYDVAIGLGLLVIPAVEISKWIRRKFA